MAQIYTGSKDETVRVWDAATGKCASVVQVGGHVDSLLMESGYLFVGMHIANLPDKPGLIKVRLCAVGDCRLSCLAESCSPELAAQLRS